MRSVYFTENSGYRSLKNRSCVTVFGSCSATLTVGEPLGDVSGSANHDFRTSVTGISGEIDASINIIIQFQSGGFRSWSRVDKRSSFFQRSLSLPLSILCDLQPCTPPTQFYLNSLQLAPPYLLWPSSISLPIHFKHQCPL